MLLWSRACCYTTVHVAIQPCMFTHRGAHRRGQAVPFQGRVLLTMYFETHRDRPDNARLTSLPVDNCPCQPQTPFHTDSLGTACFAYCQKCLPLYLVSPTGEHHRTQAVPCQRHVQAGNANRVEVQNAWVEAQR